MFKIHEAAVFRNIYLEICLSFSFSFSLAVRNYLLHSSQDRVACEALFLSEPFRNTWLALVCRGHATRE